MADFASPGIIVTERDFSATAQTLGTSTGGTVINAKWGYIGYQLTSANEDELVSQAGKPNDSNFRDWFVASTFLKYTSALKWVRVVNEATALNAVVGTSTGILIKNPDHLEVVKSVGALPQLFASKCAGNLGNTLAISMADSSTFAQWQYASQFDTAPNNSGVLPNSPNTPSNDEIHVVVVDQLGLFTGVSGTVLESFAYLSKAKDAKDVNGASSYYVNKLNASSEYVWALSPLTADYFNASQTTANAGALLSDSVPFANFKGQIFLQFNGGADGDVPTKGEYINAFDVITTPDNTDVTLLFAGGCGNDLNQPDISNHILTTASNRGDMVAFVSPKFSDIVGVTKSTVVNNILATKQALTTQDSFGVMTTGYKLIYDKYADTNRWIPCNGDDAGLCARTENKSDVWKSPAGYSRGMYVECISLAFNPDKNARDTLYKANINPICNFPNEGTLLYGDKTLQAKNSAFTWIGIRRLFIYVRKAIVRASKYGLFEFNTAYTRQAFKDLIEPIMREIKGRDGVNDYYIRCDETNNTTAVIEKGEFLADIIIKPMYSIQGIRLSFTAVRRDVSFDEVMVA